ncbi:predicted protein [Thalassiosira pseudonana CCMP1335]|uniref:DUF6824 domain-containing protein n=1 Tax=Thalassiosira pseudonana TaxID=35128 RepID=B8BV28_THAPS|nr:predicted protein [Thalassiosira pseudonana CCMP1335]EED94864.1 predicted protein [Thalassiosira pseudonana CCMP1335]
MSTGTKPHLLPVMVGATTVALGSWMAHLAGVGTTAALNTIKSLRVDVNDLMNKETFRDVVPIMGQSAIRSVKELTRPMKLMFGVYGGSGGGSSISGLTRSERKERRDAWMHAARICVLGILTYKTIFRSHFSSLAPSSYTARGSFARIGIPAPPNFNYATRSQRDKLEQIGKWWGCHTCGSRMIFSNLRSNKPKFHGDHIPPVSVAKQMNRGGQESYFHGRRLRIGHLTGGVVAALSVGTGVDVELAKTSREKTTSSASLPTTGISCPNHTDVLLGRGVSTNRHPGNESFRDIVKEHVDVYARSTKKEKMLISRSIVNRVRTQFYPPGRFLEKDLATGLWSDVGDRRACEKTAQALRDIVQRRRRERKEGEDEEHIIDPDLLNSIFD